MNLTIKSHSVSYKLSRNIYKATFMKNLSQKKSKDQ